MFSNWGSCFWNVIESLLETDSFQSKTGTTESVPHTRHKDLWQLDPLVMLLLMLILDPKSEDCYPTADGRVREPENRFMFPCLRTTKKKSVADKLNKWLKDVRNKVIELTGKETTHDIRYGAMYDMLSNEDLAALDAIFRGAWSFQGDCTGLSYFDRRPGHLRAMRVLMGFSNVFQTVKVLSMDDIDLGFNDRESVKFKNLEKHLFRRLPVSSEPGDLLYSLRRVFTATLIETYPMIVQDLKDYGAVDAANLLQETVKAEVHRMHFGMDDFMEWSATVSFGKFKTFSHFSIFT